MASRSHGINVRRSNNHTNTRAGIRRGRRGRGERSGRARSGGNEIKEQQMRSVKDEAGLIIFLLLCLLVSPLVKHRRLLTSPPPSDAGLQGLSLIAYSNRFQKFIKVFFQDSSRLLEPCGSVRVFVSNLSCSSSGIHSCGPLAQIHAE